MQRRARETWREWIARRLSHISVAEFAPHHVTYWDWIDRLAPGVKPSSFVACWPRGGGKSSTAEWGTARVCDKLSRRFVLYCCGTQDKADEHVSNIASLLMDMDIERAVNVYGASRAWRRQQLRAANGFNVAGFGLDTGLRGIKIDQYRPDWIILDDVDELGDSLPTIERKIQVITSTILPTGSTDLAVSFLQNAIHRESVMSQMIDGRADFLRDRLPVVPVPALEEMTWEERDKRYFILTGTPTWLGQDRAVCERQINEWGREAFLREAQHDVYTASRNAYFNADLLARWLKEVRSGYHTPLRPYVVPHDLPQLRACAEEGSLRLWELPEPRRRYIVTADPAGGVNTDGQRDYCSSSVLDADSFSQVAHLHGQWEPHEYAGLIDALARWYDPALIGVLRLNHGGTVLSHLTHDYEWPLATVGGRWGGVYVYNPDEVFEATRDRQKPILLPGWPEDVRTKPYMMDTLGQAIDEEWIVIRSERCLQECLTYVKLPGNKSGADTGAHDDCVSDLAIGAVLLLLRYERRRDIDERRDARKAIPEQPQTAWGGLKARR